MPLNENFAVFVRLYDEHHQTTGRLLFIPVAATIVKRAFGTIKAATLS